MRREERKTRESSPLDRKCMRNHDTLLLPRICPVVAQMRSVSNYLEEPKRWIFKYITRHTNYVVSLRGCKTRDPRMLSSLSNHASNRSMCIE